MDDQHNYPTDDADELRLILLQLDEAGRQEVYAMIRDLADKAGVPEQPATVAELFEQWKDLWRQADAAPDDAAVNAIADRAFLIEQRAVTRPRGDPERASTVALDRSDRRRRRLACPRTGGKSGTGAGPCGVVR